MSEIPYYFETPVPKYFRESGWFDCEHMFKFVHWAFSRCQTRSHKIVMMGREVTLQPFEFIAGRLTSPKECFLTENIFRNQRLKLEKAGLLKKTTNSLTNQFTCYIWITDAFCKIDNQQNNQRLTNDQPTINHKVRREKERYKKDTTPTPSQLPEKISFRENVLLTQKEFDSLLGKYGQQFLDLMLDTLDSYKGSSNKQYASDYHTMKDGGWVINRVKKDLEHGTSNEKSPRPSQATSEPKFQGNRVLRGSNVKGDS